MMVTCGTCNGSGEGMFDGSTCSHCRGSGEEWEEDEVIEDDEDGEE